MNRLNMYDRAWRMYRAGLEAHAECARDSRLFADADGQGKLAVTRMICTVDEAWVNAIEAGLVHVEKAIREERQFIYSNGEVLPIEKVKHVSKDSVQHLARHADLITRVEEGQDLIPDKLYTVERLNDYAVYENRFLYMLLCCLRDFVAERYRRIVDLTNRYDGCLTVKRDIQGVNRSFTLRMELHEERRDDPYLREHNADRAIIDRMDLILKTILAFLATPLMESAGKAALLKPPITKTNVLKMDNNFKGAVALYDYIMAYDGPGYTVEEQVRELDVYGEGIAEDMAEVELLLSFLAYRHGLGIGDELKAAYELDEAMARQEQLRQATEQLLSAERRMAEAEESPAAYLLRMEKHIRALQNEADRVTPLYAELRDSRAEAQALHAGLTAMRERVDGIDEERRSVEAAHMEELRRAEQKHRGEQNVLRAEQAAEAVTWRAAMAEQQAEIARLTAVCEELEADKRLLEARVLALRAQKKDITAAEMKAMTDEARFDELERELEAFVRFYKREWSMTKRKIRKDFLNVNYIKGQGGRS